ncbi:type II secretion system minor pseudopilin GspH [Alteromonas pelagimontana]|uniref:Type II secretion system protein H n=1 Tax=Alteromonas pelagimontana TaxID=1858656 RepID=A0A6M4MF75_9ALTE|nr:type II secretion system minor pseudopilin GspH [Alteromonas pelagimontana]QJR80816.1 type II secretion system minor pseudopilin GspH [Alteromonas pelagimontana]
MTITRSSSFLRSRNSGFTLLEVMLVLLLMGMAASYVVFNAFGASESDRLKEQATRLQVLVDMASDYAVLNQMELGLHIEPEENRYFFSYLDDEDKWQRISEEKIYQDYTLPDPFTMTLNLDDLPWNTEDQLFDRRIFDESFGLDDVDVKIGEEEKRLPPPQVLIMSSGEITPFTLTFNYEPGFGNDVPAYFILSNEDMPPLQLEGPLEQLE